IRRNCPRILIPALVRGTSLLPVGQSCRLRWEFPKGGFYRLPWVLLPVLSPVQSNFQKQVCSIACTVLWNVHCQILTGSARQSLHCLHYFSLSCRIPIPFLW